MIWFWKERRLFSIGFFGNYRVAITHGSYEISTLECAAIFNMFKRVAAGQYSHMYAQLALAHNNPNRMT